MPARRPDAPQCLPVRGGCCGCGHLAGIAEDERARPQALMGLGLAGLGGAALTGLSWSMLAAPEGGDEPAPPRRTLVVKPVFTYPLPVRQHQTSWRAWGGIQTEEDAVQEVARIRKELDQLKAAADFPVEFLPLAKVRGIGQLSAVRDIAKADVLLFYSAGDGAGDLMAEVNWVDNLGKDTIFFVRHHSGPLYYWYEGASARFHRQHTDFQATKTILCEDTVVDRMDEVLWRLRALAGLRATVGSRIVVVGWPDLSGWPPEQTMEQVRRLWKLDIQAVSYETLGRLIRAAREDQQAVDLARSRADAYLKLPGTKLETELRSVQRAFLLEQVFRGLMRKADCRAITVAACMSAIMPIAETTACLSLSLLNDAGYLALCEADFVAIPAAMLLGNVSGRPTFMNAPTFPHEGVITLAHCTAPRKMDGKGLEPVRIMTHYESDYGAAPRVQMATGRQVTMIVPDFASKRWLGLSGEIESNPLLAVCRTQIDVRFKAPSLLVAERMPGYRWVLIYGDYLRETGYALRRVPIQWDCLG